MTRASEAPEEIARYNPRAPIALTLTIGLIIAGAMVLAGVFMIFTIGLAPLVLGASVIVAASQLARGRRNKLAVVVAATLTGVLLLAEVAAVWFWGAAFELADANKPIGSSGAYFGLSLVLAAAAFIGLVATTIALQFRARRYPRIQVS